MLWSIVAANTATCLPPVSQQGASGYTSVIIRSSTSPTVRSMLLFCFPYSGCLFSFFCLFSQPLILSVCCCCVLLQSPWAGTAPILYETIFGCGPGQEVNLTLAKVVRRCLCVCMCVHVCFARVLSFIRVSALCDLLLCCFCSQQPSAGYVCVKCHRGSYSNSIFATCPDW